MRRASFSFTLGVMLLLSLAVPALAAQPTIVRESFEDQFADPFLSEICGLDVMVSVSGHVVSHVWTDADDNFVREVFNISVRGSISAGGETLHFVDTGMDKSTALEDDAVRVEVHGNIRLLTAKGAGLVLGAAGRSAFILTPLLDEEGNPVLDEFGNPVFDFELLADTGVRAEDFEALCDALAPSA